MKAFVFHSLTDHIELCQATFLIADAQKSLEITGVGDVIEPHDGIMGKDVSSVSVDEVCNCNCSVFNDMNIIQASIGWILRNLSPV